MCIKDIKDMNLERSVDLRMGISQNGAPIKSFSVHRSCSTPLWKIALIGVGVGAGIVLLCHAMKRRYREDDECCL